MSKGFSLSRVFGVIGSAISVAGAVESRRRAKDRDLRALGISPEDFRHIRMH